MQDPGTKALMAIVERLASIEEQLKKLDRIDSSIEKVREVSYEARNRADKAGMVANENSKDIDKLTATIKWSITLVTPIILSLIGAVLSMLVK